MTISVGLVCLGGSDDRGGGGPDGEVARVLDRCEALAVLLKAVEEVRGVLGGVLHHLGVVGRSDVVGRRQVGVDDDEAAVLTDSIDRRASRRRAQTRDPS